MTSTFFGHKRFHKYTHYSRNLQGTRSQIDHILVRRRWRSSVLDSRVFRGADFCNTDHRLLIARLKVKLRSEKPTFKPKIDIDRFAESTLRKEFELKVGNKFEGLIDELDELEVHWKKVKETTMSLAVESCGTKNRKKEK